MNTKTLCLAVLSLGKASGYDIGKRLEDPFGHFVDVARSGVYPILKTLEEEGLVQYENVEQSALPNKKDL
jgi:PadR family transcriptional regulator AphA